MERVTKQINEAVEGEGKNLPKFSTYEYFENELGKYSIASIVNNPRVDIKSEKNNDRFIFFIDTTPAFIIGASDLERWVRQFSEKNEKLEAEQGISIELKGMELIYLKAETKEDLVILQDSINKLKNSESAETSIEFFKYRLERNITALEQQIEEAQQVNKEDKKDRILRKAYIAQIQPYLTDLYRMKEKIEVMEKYPNKKYTIDWEDVNEKKQVKEVKMDDINGFKTKEILKSLNERLDEIIKEQKNIVDTEALLIKRKAGVVPYYEIVIKNKAEAKKLKKLLKKTNKQYAILDEIELDAAKKIELARDLERLEEYLNMVIDQPDTFDLSKTPFVPTHKEEFFALVEQDATLAELFSLNKTNTKKKGTQDGTGTETRAGTETETNKNTQSTETDKNAQSRETPTKEYDNAKEAFAKGGIGGLFGHRLDKSNMTENQKQMRGGVGNLALTGGIIFVGWKMISSAFKLLTKKGRSEGELSKNLGRLLGPAAVIFGAQARSGEGPLNLFKGGNLTEKIAGVFGRGARNKETTRDELTQTKVYTEGFIGLMGAFDMMTYGGMATVLEETPDGKMKIKEDQYDGFIGTLENGNDNQKAGAKFLKTHVGKNDKNGLMDLTLRSMGITSMQDLKDNPNKEFQETAAGAATRVYSIYAFMEKEGFVRINPETMHLVNEYIADPNATVDDLENLKKRGDVFETQESITDQTGLAARIKTIAGTDTIKERDMINGINNFYEYRPTGDKSGLDIIGNGPVVEFKTYGYTTKINTDTKKIDGLNTDKFDSYAELFKAANLTNRLKYLCKDRTAIKENPFYIQSNDLMFDEAKIFSTSFDTEMVEEKTLKDISPILSKFDEEYCTYLNSSRPKFRKTLS